MKLLKGPPVKDPRTVMERFWGTPVQESKNYEAWKRKWKTYWKRQGRWEELKRR